MVMSRLGSEHAYIAELRDMSSHDPILVSELRTAERHIVKAGESVENAIRRLRTEAQR